MILHHMLLYLVFGHEYFIALVALELWMNFMNRLTVESVSTIPFSIISTRSVVLSEFIVEHYLMLFQFIHVCIFISTFITCDPYVTMVSSMDV